MTTSTLRTRVERIEQRAGLAPRIWLVYQGSEPEPVDVPDGGRVISLVFVSSDGDGRVGEQTPALDLSVPLPPDVETALANRDADGMAHGHGYHAWDAEAREFVSPFGLRRPALPRPGR